MPERRITCPRHHLLFQLVAEGIAIKCRGGECRQVYVVTWAELDAKRQEVGKGGDDHGRIYPSWEEGSLRFQEGHQGSKTEAPEKEEIALHNQ